MAYYSRPEFMWCRPMHGLISSATYHNGSRVFVQRSGRRSVVTKHVYLRVTFWRWVCALCTEAVKLHKNGLPRRKAAWWFLRCFFSFL
jgi:hypothetical protein